MGKALAVTAIHTVDAAIETGQETGSHLLTVVLQQYAHRLLVELRVIVLVEAGEALAHGGHLLAVGLP